MDMTYRTAGLCRPILPSPSPSFALACLTWPPWSTSLMPLLADKAERFVFASPLLYIISVRRESTQGQIMNQSSANFEAKDHPYHLRLVCYVIRAAQETRDQEQGEDYYVWEGLILEQEASSGRMRIKMVVHRVARRPSRCQMKRPTTKDYGYYDV